MYSGCRDSYDLVRSLYLGCYYRMLLGISIGNISPVDDLEKACGVLPAGSKCYDVSIDWPGCPMS